MLKAFLFDNFKSFDKARLDLENLTILIGSNSGGKTNAIEGIRILSEIATGRDFSIILDGSKNVDSDIRGGSRGCPKLNSNHFGLGCILELSDEFELHYMVKVKIGERIYVEEESLSKRATDGQVELIFKTKRPQKDSGDIKVEYNNGKKGTNPDIICVRSSAILPQMASKMPTDSERLKENVQYIHSVIGDLRKMLFLNPIPSEMRDYSRINDSELRPKADNISSVLYRLFQSSSNKQKILSIVKQLPENDVIDIDFIQTKIGDVMFQLKERYGKSTDYIEAKRLSDGVIRCIAVIASIISEKPGSMVIIEEVDNGIHPSRARSLIQAISALAKERNIDVIITTHNPALLNSVSREDIMGVSICYRNVETGSSEFIQILDIEGFPALFAQGKLGDLAIEDKIVAAIKQRRKTGVDYDWLKLG